MAELIVKSGDGLTSRHPLGSAPVSIGRHPECDIVVNDPQASRRHARVQATPQGYVFEDLSSANGSLLNGRLLTEPTLLKDGDRVAIGSVSLELQVTPRRPETRGTMGEAPPGAMPVQDMSMSMVTFAEDVGAAGAPSFDYKVDAEKGVMSGVDAAAVAADPAIAEGAIHKLRQRLETMVRVSEALASTLKTNEMLESIMDRLLDTFPQCDRGFILLADPGQEGQLMPQVVRNREAKPGEASDITVSKSVISEARKTRSAVLVSDTGLDSRFAAALSIARFQIRSVMCTPLIAVGEDLGVIYLDTKSREKAFTPDDLQLFNAITAQAAVSLRVAKLALQAQQEAQIRSRMQRYFPPDLVDKMVKGEFQTEPGGSLKTGTVFFSDIIGFSKMARRKAPADVINLLNRYFKVMEELIFRRNGTIDKFGGDAIMAFWGVLVDTPQAAYHAALSAMDMQNALYPFNWLSRKEGLEPITMGIGLNTGEFVAGNVGSDQMVEFTVIGEAVNLAQRVESLAGRGQVFVTKATLEEFRERAVVVALPPCPVKGYSDPVEAFSVRGLVSPDAERRVIRRAETIRFPTPVLHMSIPAAFEPGPEQHIQGLVRACETDGSEVYLEAELVEPIQAGARARIVPDLQEKASLQPMDAVVVESGVTRSDELGQRNLIVFRVTEPDRIFRQFCRPGTVIPSDLSGPDAIIRA